MSTDNNTMDFYTLNFPFTLNLLLEPSNFPSVWREREDEGKSASLKSCPRHQTVKSSDAQSQKKKRKMNLFFWPCWPKQTRRHTDVWLPSDPSSTQPLTQDQETDPGCFFQSWLDSDRCRFRRGRPLRLWAWQLYPTANTTADLSDQHRSNRSHNAPVQKKIHLTLGKDDFKETYHQGCDEGCNDNRNSAFATFSFIVYCVFSLSALWQINKSVGRCRARVQRRLGPYHKCYFTLLFHINIAIDDINVKGGWDYFNASGLFLFFYNI